MPLVLQMPGAAQRKGAEWELKHHCSFQKHCGSVSERSQGQQSACEEKWFCPGQCGSVVWASSCAPKGHQLDSASGHIPRLRVWSLVGVYTRSNWWMFPIHINVSLSVSASVPRLPSSLSKDQCINPQVRGKKEQWFCKQVYVWGCNCCKA